jgi:maltose O-acetyltransferase
MIPREVNFFLKLFLAGIRKTFFYKCKLMSFVYKMRCKIKALLAGGNLQIGKEVNFQVPVRVDGPGSVLIGAGVGLGYRPAFRLGSGELLLQARSKTAHISIGSKTILNNNVSMVSLNSIEIGNNCLIGDQVAILDSDFHEISPHTRNRSTGKSAPVRIGNNVWLGSRVMVLKGVEIGDGSVIAAGSVVIKSIPPMSVAGGIPAKVFRTMS